MGLHRNQRKRFVSCLSSLCSSGVAPAGWRHTLEFWEPSAAQPAHTLVFILEKRAFVLQVTEVHKQLWPDDLYLLTGQEVRCSEHSGPRQLRHKLGLLLFLALLQLTIFYVIITIPFPSHVSDFFITLKIF